jgi:CDP-diglyceride synthetase
MNTQNNPQPLPPEFSVQGILITIVCFLLSFAMYYFTEQVIPVTSYTLCKNSSDTKRINGRRVYIEKNCVDPGPMKTPEKVVIGSCICLILTCIVAMFMSNPIPKN